ncbi:MAG: RAMP superfamily CRISPR-associated protein, partial [candidate division KSB1 bacterium]|nr:RAMP superfamily CRISPR-associated protein [candidate division KSB1 bacterium]
EGKLAERQKEGLGSHEKGQQIFDRRKKDERRLFSTFLFGGFRGDEGVKVQAKTGEDQSKTVASEVVNEGQQSPLVVYDACLVGKPEAVNTELRDGVTIDMKTRTAEDKKKFDIELLSTGTKFLLRFELNIGVPEQQEEEEIYERLKETVWRKELEERRHKLLTALATALNGFAPKDDKNRSEITLGARKRRGYGECCVKEWTVRRYDVTEKNCNDLLAWLISEREGWSFEEIQPVESKTNASILDAINAFEVLKKKPVSIIDDKRQQIKLEAEFVLDGSLLIRSGFGESLYGPDTTHLHSPRNGKPLPVVSGTSWAGVLRHRAGMIARTLAVSDVKAEKFIEGIFGSTPRKKEPEEQGDVTENAKDKKKVKEQEYLRASRLVVKETVIQKPEKQSLIQTRVKIDRFTGGAFETALFSEEPIWGDENTRLKLELILRAPAPDKSEQAVLPRVPDAEIGLLLLLVKDLWTGDLPIGGEASIGRGRLQGKNATLTLADGKTSFVLEARGKYGVDVKEGDQKTLEGFVKAFKTEMERDEKNK